MTDYHLHLILTDDDVDDLRYGEGSINTLTAEGIEVAIGPVDFAPDAWTILDTGDSVMMDLRVIGQYNVPVEVTV